MEMSHLFLFPMHSLNMQPTVTAPLGPAPRKLSYHVVS